MDINTFLDVYGLAAIFTLLLIKAIGVPIPIPADALMLAASARVADGKFVLWQAFLAILVALVAGGMVQFVIVQGPGRSLLYRYGRYLGLTPERLDKATGKVKDGNPVTIGVAILTPGVRSVTIPACGIAGVAFNRFVSGITLGSGLFLALHFFLGLIGGSLLSRLGEIISVPYLVSGLVVFLLVGLGIWYAIRRRQMPHASRSEVFQSALGAWHEATCPACLALGAVNKLQITAEHKH